jgi:hypothetical protein
VPEISATPAREDTSYRRLFLSPHEGERRGNIGGSGETPLLMRLSTWRGVYIDGPTVPDEEVRSMRRLLVGGMAVMALLAGASVARADHTHVLILPNGKCAILAAQGNEKYQILPEVLFSNNPNVDADDAAGGLAGLPLNRRHPLHVLVHLGVPGADGDIAVMGSAQDPCAATGDYVNG